MQNSKSSHLMNRREMVILQVLTILLLLGRAWQGIFWDLPLRAFFWNQALLEGWVTWWTGKSWQEYATDVEGTDAFINNLNAGLGYFWLFCALIAGMIHLRQRWMKWLMYLASLSLLLLAFLYWMEKFMKWGQFFEYSLQIASPVLLVYVFFNGQNTLRFRYVVRVLIAIAFTCHGLYAVGFYPQPGPWVQWCMDVLFLPGDAAAQQFLVVMGILDFIAAAMLLIPQRQLVSIALWYCIIWGFMTAFARVVSNFYLDFPVNSIHQWLHETLVRLVHGGIPLLLYFWELKTKKTGKDHSTK